MTRYWVIAPYDADQAELFERAWKYDVQNQVIAIGWGQIGDPGPQSQEELRAKISQLWPKNVTGVLNTIWRLYHDIAAGDVVIARRGTKKLVGVGTVTRRAFYDERMGEQRVGMADADKAYPNFLGVEWKDLSEIAFDRIIFSMQTMYEVSEEKYAQITDRHIPIPADADPYEFVMEKYLREFIVSNFQRVFGGALELVGSYILPETLARLTY